MSASPVRPVIPPPPVPAPSRRAQRYRDFGIGYGHSNGYARQGRYTSNAFSARFRLG